MSATPAGHNSVVLNSVSGVVQVVAPASNTKGLELRTANIMIMGGGFSVYTGPTAPSGHGDTTKPVIMGGSRNTNDYHVFPLTYPLFLPAGYGLWVTQSAGATSGFNATWDLLA